MLFHSTGLGLDRATLERACEDEDVARNFLEAILWPDGPVCPRCRTLEVRIVRTQAGSWRCRTCQKYFKLTTGTLFEGTHLKLHRWLQSVMLMGTSETLVTDLMRKVGMMPKTAVAIARKLRSAEVAGDTLLIQLRLLSEHVKTATPLRASDQCGAGDE